MQTRQLIGGQWVGADSGREIEVRDPATDKLVAKIPDGGGAETKRAIEAAAGAFPEWSRTTAGERGKILRRFADLMMAQQERLAALMTAEQGKPLAEARGEIAYAASFIDWAAEEGKRVYGETIPASGPSKRILVLRQPVGVTAAITPWNFPAAMITRKLGPALASGCTMVVKPAEQTPLSAIALGELAMEAGLPAGCFNIVTGDAKAIGAEIFRNPVVRKVSFTGSTEVGKILMKMAAENVTRLSLELGGHAPFIVFDDADLNAAVEGAIATKLRNAGQTCICANRIYVQKKAHGEFVKRFFAPTIVDGFTDEMLVAREETFGPVAPVRSFETEEEAVAMANNSPFGLAAYFYTRDASRLMRVAEALEYGIVGANDALPSTAQAPFGGVKQSGFGREGGHHGMHEYTAVKYVSWGL